MSLPTESSQVPRLIGLRDTDAATKKRELSAKQAEQRRIAKRRKQEELENVEEERQATVSKRIRGSCGNNTMAQAKQNAIPAAQSTRPKSSRTSARATKTAKLEDSDCETESPHSPTKRKLVKSESKVISSRKVFNDDMSAQQSVVSTQTTKQVRKIKHIAEAECVEPSVDETMQEDDMKELTPELAKLAEIAVKDPAQYSSRCTKTGDTTFVGASTESGTQFRKSATSRPQIDRSKVAFEKRLVIAIDLGTTNSGIAWVVDTGDVQMHHIKVVALWKSPDGLIDKEKCPTRLAIPADNPGTTETHFGFNIPEGTLARTWYKLEFACDKKLMEFDDPELKKVIGEGLGGLPPNTTIEQMLKETYRQLFTIGKACIREASHRLRCLDTIPVTLVVTVPAEYKDEKRKQVMQLVEETNLFDNDLVNRILIRSEAESAASFVVYNELQEPRDEDDEKELRAGDAVLIFDIGGGSIDSVVFEITKLDMPAFQELVPGKGAYCGSTSVHRQFIKKCDDWFGQAFKDLPVDVTGPASPFMNKFTSAMQMFRGTEFYPIRLQLPELFSALDGRGLKSDRCNYEGYVDIDVAVMRSFYRELEEKGTALIEQRIEDVDRANIERSEPTRVKALILCGGFAQCPYVETIFRQFCIRRYGDHLDVIIAAHPWSCIARRAVLNALFPTTIQRRKSSVSLGIEVTEIWNADVHSEENRFYCPAQGTRSKGHISWLLHKNATIKVGDTRRLEFSIAVVRGEATVQFQIDLWSTTEQTNEKSRHRIDSEGVFLSLETIGVFEVPKNFWQDEPASKKNKSADLRATLDLIAETGMLAVRVYYGTRLVQDCKLDFKPTPYR